MSLERENDKSMQLLGLVGKVEELHAPTKLQGVASFSQTRVDPV